jgi:hypothetical protein
MKRFAIFAFSTAFMVSGAAGAATNLLSNGSFETGFFTDWHIHDAPTHRHFPCVVVNNPTTAATEPTGGLSPDPVGTDFMFCVANPSNESITQRVMLTPGDYDIGFTAYPFSYQESDDETFTAYVGHHAVASISSASVAANQWYLVTGSIHITHTRMYTIRFEYDVAGTMGRDMYLDRLYLIQRGGK